MDKLRNLPAQLLVESVEKGQVSISEVAVKRKYEVFRNFGHFLFTSESWKTGDMLTAASIHSRRQRMITMHTSATCGFAFSQSSPLIDAPVTINEHNT